MLRKPCYGASVVGRFDNGVETALYRSPRKTIVTRGDSRKPFDVLADGLISKNSRVDRTAIELFLMGISAWETVSRQRIDDENH